MFTEASSQCGLFDAGVSVLVSSESCNKIPWTGSLVKRNAYVSILKAGKAKIHTQAEWVPSEGFLHSR